jgi:uncharacterized protein (TIGR03067 family)
MRKVLGILAVGLLLGAYPPQAKDVKKDLQGTWEVTSLESMGQKVPADQLKQLGMKMTFKDDKVTLQGKGQPDEVMTIKLDASQKPKTIDATDPQNKLEKGIFELEGDTLKMCIAQPGADRPKDFTSTKDTMLIIAKRAKP